MSAGTILTMGGGGFSMEPDNPLLDDFLLSLVPGDAPPRVCFLPTASGDSDDYTKRFQHALATPRARTSVLSLFRREHTDLRSFVLSQDIIYVGGGNTANMLALWRLHGLDKILAEALGEGVVLAGLSAGMNCWFQASVTDSFGAEELQPLDDGLAFLTGSACPHYDGEEQRRPTYLELVAAGRMPGGYAADDGCALLFRNGRLADAVSSRPAARAFHVHRALGVAVEDQLPVRFLGAEA
jgi:dipeptidase E